MRPEPPKSPFTYQQAMKLGFTKYALKKLLQEKTIEKIGRGLYQLIDESEADWRENQYRGATLRCGEPSAIGLLSALEHYHLTDIISKKVWVIVPQSKRVKDKSLPD